jgi:hypothetical protein
MPSAFPRSLTVGLWAVGVIALILFLTGSWSVWFGLRVLHYSDESMTWPSTQGWMQTMGMGQSTDATGSESSPFVQYL